MYLNIQNESVKSFSFQLEFHSLCKKVNYGANYLYYHIVGHTFSASASKFKIVYNKLQKFSCHITMLNFSVCPKVTPITQ